MDLLSIINKLEETEYDILGKNVYIINPNPIFKTKYLEIFKNRDDKTYFNNINKIIKDSKELYSKILIRNLKRIIEKVKIIKKVRFNLEKNKIYRYPISYKYEKKI